MNKKWNWFFTVALLFGLVFSGSNQLVFAQAPAKADFKLSRTPGNLIVGRVLSSVIEPSAEADFTFTSDPNPSSFGQEVTFTLSATGTDSTYPPFGSVDFYDNEVEIPFCQNVALNFVNDNPAAGNPATCTTSSLSAGTHNDITAKFSSIMTTVYADETVLLEDGQIVNEPISLTIEPSTFTDAMISVYKRFFLSALYPGGSSCDTCNWTTTNGTLPDGISLISSTGEMVGTPTTIGSYTFTIQVDDGNGAQGSQDYTWEVTKVKTIVSVGTTTATLGSTEATTLGATAKHPDQFYPTAPTGKISFSVNGVPVPGCSGSDAITTNNWGSAYCTSFVPTGLSVGSYEITADFTPDTSSSDQYLSGSGVGELLVKVKPNISLFISTPTFYGHKFNLNAFVRTENNNPIAGTVDYYIDDEPVFACQNVTQNLMGEFICQDVSLLLAVGSHSLSAEFTPTDTSTYDIGWKSSSFTVEGGSYLISGIVFNDSNQDGVMVSTEYGISSWKVNLTTCDGDPVMGTDGIVIGSQVTGYFGGFTFTKVPGGQCIHVIEEVQPGWKNTTPTQLEFTLSQDIYLIKFGNFYPNIKVNLVDSSMPNGKVGEVFGPISFSADGGDSPYKFTIRDGFLPDGLELREDGVLSGTPELAGDFFFSVQAEDKDKAVGYDYYFITVTEDATFTVFLPLVGNR